MSMLNQKMPIIRINAMLNSIRSIMSIIFPLITYPYVTRVLQAENLGKVNFASSTLSYFSLIAVLGLTSYAAREGAGLRNNKENIKTTDTICITILLTVI